MPLDAPGCTRATMIIAVSFLQSSCVAIKNQSIILIILCFFKCFTYLYDYPTSKVSG